MLRKFIKGMFVGLLMVCAVFFVNSASIISDTQITADDIVINDDLTVADDVTIKGTLTKPQDTAIKMYSNTSDAIGEPMPLELYGVVPEAKPFLEWKTWYFDNNQSTMVYGYTAWLGAHYNSSLNSDRHQHFAIETLDLNTSTVNTRFAIDYGRFLENMTAYFNAINYLELRTGVDLRFKDSGSEVARFEYASDDNFRITGKNNLSLEPDENIVITDGRDIIMSGVSSINHYDALELYPEGSDTFGLRIELNDQDGNTSIKGVGGTEVLHIGGEVKIDSVKGDGTNYVLCILDDETIGSCDIGGGSCTCA